MTNFFHKIIIPLPLFLSSAFGVGFIPIAPGTCGTLFGIVTFFLLKQTFSLQPSGMFTATAILFFISLSIISKAQKHLQDKDDRRIILDEIVGIWFVLCFIPADIISQLFGFVLFRFFDVIKPMGIKKIQELPDSWGIIFDDLLAGFYTIVVVALLKTLRSAI